MGKSSFSDQDITLNPSPASSYALVVKKNCPTCALIEPVINSLAKNSAVKLRVYVQDDISFVKDVADLGAELIDDTDLEFSYKNAIEIVPTLIRLGADEKEQSRVFGWDKQQWQEFTAMAELGTELVDFKPGCGSRTQDPGMDEVLALRFDSQRLQARKIELAEAEDIME
ncbi:MAG: hypothetical protein HQ498_11390, partial [Pseudohongiella sp.]|nr:hypothetical protein [Pseudohongiella sp.]